MSACVGLSGLIQADIVYKQQISLYGGVTYKFYMNAKIKVIRQLLAQIIDDIDNGHYDRTDDEIDAAIDVFSTLNHGIKRYSKRWLCDNVLHCSESCFNHYLSIGIIPEGNKVGIGFKEKCWSISDMRAAIEYRKIKS
jgi:hypothetical protein